MARRACPLGGSDLKRSVRFQQSANVIRCHTLEERLVVELEHGRRAARSETLHLGQRELAVRRDLAGANTQGGFDLPYQLARTTQGAGDVGAHLDVAASHLGAVEHGIKRHDLLDLDGEQIEQSRNFVDDLAWQVTVFGLCQVQGRQQRRAGLRVILAQRDNAGATRV
jgi:hypothetical protein